MFLVVLLMRLAVPDDEIDGELVGWRYVADTVGFFAALLVVFMVLSGWQASVAALSAAVAYDYLITSPLRRRATEKRAPTALDGW